jgi:G3E family GTPase
MASASPFAARKQSVPVRIETDAGKLAALAGHGVAVVRLEAPAHAHPDGTACIVCETRGDVRVALFELLERERLGAVPPFDRVVVDATAVTDLDAVVDALVPGRRPAFGLRDFTVARSFHLADAANMIDQRRP